MADGAGFVLFMVDLLGGVLVPLFFLREIAEQLADAGVDAYGEGMGVYPVVFCAAAS